MRRGFVKEANGIAAEVRAELGLGPLDGLDPRRLAAHLDIPLAPISSLAQQAPAAVAYFLGDDSFAFSAVTVFDGSRRQIFYNDGHTPTRQASDITHELSHALLLHSPSPALDYRGCRDWDPDMEEEAQRLAGVLLITEEAALHIAREDLSLVDAADRYGVSVSMAQYRVNITGARRRATYLRQAQSRPIIGDNAP